MLPLILGAVAATLSATVFSTVFRVGVEIDGEEIVARALKDLRATETLGGLAANVSHILSHLAANSEEVTDAVAHNLSVLTADLHDLAFYLKLLLFAATAYIVLRGVLVALKAFKERHAVTHVYLLYPDGKVTNLGHPGQPRILSGILSNEPDPTRPHFTALVTNDQSARILETSGGAGGIARMLLQLQKYYSTY